MSTNNESSGRTRVRWSPAQLARLEQLYGGTAAPVPTDDERAKIVAELSKLQEPSMAGEPTPTDSQVKFWFHNKRSRMRKLEKEANGGASPALNGSGAASGGTASGTRSGTAGTTPTNVPNPPDGLLHSGGSAGVLSTELARLEQLHGSLHSGGGAATATATVTAPAGPPINVEEAPSPVRQFPSAPDIAPAVMATVPVPLTNAPAPAPPHVAAPAPRMRPLAPAPTLNPRPMDMRPPAPAPTFPRPMDIVMGCSQAQKVMALIQQAQIDLNATLLPRTNHEVGTGGCWRAVARIHFVSPDGAVRLNTLEEVAAFVNNRLTPSTPAYPAPMGITHGAGGGGGGGGGSVEEGATAGAGAGGGLLAGTKRKAGELEGGSGGLLSESDLVALNSDVIAEKLAEKLAPVVRETILQATLSTSTNEGTKQGRVEMTAAGDQIIAAPAADAVTPGVATDNNRTGVAKGASAAKTTAAAASAEGQRSPGRRGRPPRNVTSSAPAAINVAVTPATTVTPTVRGRGRPPKTVSTASPPAPASAPSPARVRGRSRSRKDDTAASNPSVAAEPAPDAIAAVPTPAAVAAVPTAPAAPDSTQAAAAERINGFTGPHYPVGTIVRKPFDDIWFVGEIVEVDEDDPLLPYFVRYEDGDEEDMEHDELAKWVVKGKSEKKEMAKKLIGVRGGNIGATATTEVPAEAAPTAAAAAVVAVEAATEVGEEEEAAVAEEEISDDEDDDEAVANLAAENPMRNRQVIDQALRECARNKLGVGQPDGFQHGHITIKVIQGRLPPSAHPRVNNTLKAWVEALVAYDGKLIDPPPPPSL